MGKVTELNKTVEASNGTGENPLMVLAKKKFEEFDMDDKEIEKVKEMINKMDLEEEDEGDLSKAMQKSKDKEAFIKVVQDFTS